MVEKLSLEADLVCAHSRTERHPEVGTREPARQKPEPEQQLSEAAGPDPRVPLADRLDVVQTAARRSIQAGNADGRRRSPALGQREANEPGNCRPSSARYHSSESLGGIPRSTRYRSGPCRSCSGRTPSSAGRSDPQGAAGPQPGRTSPSRHPPGVQPVVLRRAEVLECAEAHDRVKRTEPSRTSSRASSRWTSRP